MTTIEILEKIFGSVAKIKIIRLFLFNPQTVFSSSDITERAKIKALNVRKEITPLLKIGLIRKKSVTKSVEQKTKTKHKISKKKKEGWILNRDFAYLEPLQQFLVTMSPLTHRDIAGKFSKVGKIKLLLVSGVFINNMESRVDLLVVGDKLKKSTVQSIITTLEAEVGKELTYAAFETEDFLYRLRMCDKLIRDILDFEHHKIISKLELSS